MHNRIVMFAINGIALNGISILGSEIITFIL